MPDTEREIVDQIESLQGERTQVWIERAGSRPGQGVASSFQFGMNYGLLRGALSALRLPFEAVTPGQWQRTLRCLSGGDKSVTRARAQELFPHLRITNATADAVLIAEYGRRSLMAGRS